MTDTTRKSKINYKDLDKLFDQAGAGVYHKMSYAIWLLNDCHRGFEQWNNEVFAAHCEDALASLKTLKTQYIQAANERAEKNNASKSADNATIPVLGQLDAQMLNQLFQQMIAAQAAGNLVAAQNADTSMKQVQDGVLHQQGDAQVAA